MSRYLIFNSGLSAAIHAWHEMHVGVYVCVCAMKCRTICSFANEWLVALCAAVLVISIALSQFSFFSTFFSTLFSPFLCSIFVCLQLQRMSFLPCWCPFLNGKSHTSICLASIAVYTKLQRRIKINEHGACQPNITRWPPTSPAVTSSVYTHTKVYLKMK